jgi:hypothetical protein
VLGLFLFLATKVSGAFGTMTVLAAVPFAVAVVLSQQLIPLRSKRAAYRTSSARDRIRIAREVREYQRLMEAGGLVNPVIALLSVFKSDKPPLGNKRQAA